MNKVMKEQNEQNKQSEMVMELLNMKEKCDDNVLKP
jgi:hypothetical protein